MSSIITNLERLWCGVCVWYWRKVWHWNSRQALAGASTNCCADQSSVLCKNFLLWLLSHFIPGLIRPPHGEVLGNIIRYTYASFMVFFYGVRFSCVYFLLVMPYCSYAVWKLCLFSFHYLYRSYQSAMSVTFFCHVIVKRDYFYTFILHWYKLGLWCFYRAVSVPFLWCLFLHRKWDQCII